MSNSILKWRWKNFRWLPWDNEEIFGGNRCLYLGDVVIQNFISLITLISSVCAHDE
eukprot:m.282202 g.282202  ORF g.282202 m.282202 type:complete len:56 (+) comp19845_c0_seq4:1677-1844(+)